MFGMSILFRFEIDDGLWLISRPILIKKPKRAVCEGVYLKPKRLRNFNIERAYPKDALDKEIEGKISLHMKVNEKGLVSEVKTSNAMPSGVFEEHAIKVAKFLLFEPAYDNCTPVKAQYDLTIVFKLE